MMRALRSPILLLLFAPLAALKAQVTVLNGTGLTIQPGTTLTVNNDLNLNSGATLVQRGTLVFKGSFANNGTAQFPAGSRLLANGTARQQLSGTGLFSLPYFTVNNAAGVELLNPVSITDSLILANGVLTSSAVAPVRLATTAASPEETANSYILGHALMEARPVGTAALAPFLGLSLSAGGEVGNLELTRITGPSAVVSTVAPKTSIAAQWQVRSSVNPTAVGRSATFSWQPALDNNINMRAVDLYGAGATGVYRKLNGDSVNISASSPRNFASGTLDTLDRTYTLSSSVPDLQFLNLTGRLVSAGVELQWTTGREVNNAGFDVERAVDGVRFTKVAFVEGKNSTPINNYTQVDRDVHKLRARAVYYRLRQVDVFGNFQYSNTIVVSLNNSTLYRFHVYPNPFQHELKIDIHKEDSDPVTVLLVSANGARVYQQKYSVSRKGTIHLKGLAGLASGSYFLRVVNDHIDDTIEVLKSN